MLTHANALSEAAAGYRVLLCDVWGVVHNGVAAYPAACAALAQARRDGKAVVLLTNSPRPSASVARQLEGLGVPAGTYDRIVTSGDVTRHLIEAGPRRIFFLGPERDRVLLSGLAVETVDRDEAEAILCTGLFDDAGETPDDYQTMLDAFCKRGLPMICANPDVVVERGERLVYCAGALAALYEELGGETRIAGKPFAPIYEEAMQVASALVQGIDRQEVLAIGDGLATDVRGAQDFGLDVLYISAGVHARHYGGANLDADCFRAYLAEHGAAPRFWMESLV